MTVTVLAERLCDLHLWVDILQRDILLSWSNLFKSESLTQSWIVVTINNNKYKYMKTTILSITRKENIVSVTMNLDEVTKIKEFISEIFEIPLDIDMDIDLNELEDEPIDSYDNEPEILKEQDSTAVPAEKVEPVEIIVPVVIPTVEVSAIVKDKIVLTPKEEVKPVESHKVVNPAPSGRSTDSYIASGEVDEIK
jgi:hypothetical protein